MRVGFIIDGNIPTFGAVFRSRMSPHRLFTGWPGGSSVSEMRFGWIARELRRTGSELRYELFRPWWRYAAVVFLKSMSDACWTLAQQLRKQGCLVVFDANVDYYTVAPGEGYYQGMAPTETQRRQAIRLTEFADGVIASSRHLAEICQKFNPNTGWIPDNVPLDLAPAVTLPVQRPFPLWWSGEPVKLFELLLIESALRKHRDQIHLHLVTNSLAALDRWKEGLAVRFRDLLSAVPHTIHRFQSIADLLSRYATGGVILSPRYLDHPYNLGHSEWKLTLGMACGLPAMASPVPSYRDVAAVAAPEAIRICENENDWDKNLADLLSGAWSLDTAAEAARRVVAERYSTTVVSRQHEQFLRKVLERREMVGTCGGAR